MFTQGFKHAVWRFCIPLFIQLLYTAIVLLN
uniref:Uncharacterized protein n=1 Tax=Rhizophora mucronata TaxID=61149 RepID=A0A2P2QBS3_RHIMU